MPKEVVYGESFVQEEGQDAGAQQPVAIVRWSREAGDVQLVTREHSAEVFFDSDHPDAPMPVQYGYYVSLNRRGINDLIRHLRRARDQAFGRDE